MISSTGQTALAHDVPSAILNDVPRNRLLAALPRDALGHVLPALTHVELSSGMVIYEPKVRITYVYFVLTGIISMVSEMREGTVEVGTVGCEGMTGIPIVLAADTMPSRAFVQVPGEALRMTADELTRTMQEVPAFRSLVYRHVLALFDQTAQHAACNRLHALEERCARWLLMTHDRVEGDVLMLKQQFLAEMLGVHRPAVTLAAGALQKAGIIRYSRGKVTVLDRDALEKASCECYGIVTRRMEELLAMEL
ncbi:MAG TPA: Crp/Fnr family transcriptional regulator [Gemmatimonadaceae bacterium]